MIYLIYSREKNNWRLDYIDNILYDIQNKMILDNIRELKQFLIKSE